MCYGPEQMILGSEKELANAKNAWKEGGTGWVGGKTVGLLQGGWLGNIFVPYDYERVLYRQVVESGPDGLDAVSLLSPRVPVPAVLVAAAVAAEMEWRGRQ